MGAVNIGVEMPASSLAIMKITLPPLILESGSLICTNYHIRYQSLHPKTTTLVARYQTLLIKGQGSLSLIQG
jgi:hypothetical protein